MKKDYGFKVGDQVIHNGEQTTIIKIKNKDSFWGFKRAELASNLGWEVSLKALYEEQKVEAMRGGK